MNINATTKTICLLGHPVKHSFSPIMHNYLFEKYNINNVYICLDVDPTNLTDCIKGIKAMGIVGMNVTIPHKVAIMKELDCIQGNSKIIGAINTIKNNNGNLEGYNTDGIGFVKSITDQNYKLENKNVMILGAGGASRSICVELASNGVNSIEIRNRSIENAREIESTISKHFQTKVSSSSEVITQEDLKNIDILINTTPIGMESDECPIDESIILQNNVLVCDIVYKPHDTRFIKWAKKQNTNVIYGIDMLINQGLEAFYIWTGKNPTKEDKKKIKELYENYIDK